MDGNPDGSTKPVTGGEPSGPYHGDTTVRIPEGILPDGWSQTRYGDPICPCGHHIEQDGECPNGHVSPLREMGMI